jgi:hypothetical protein
MKRASGEYRRPSEIDKKENMPEWRKQEQAKRPVEGETNWELPEKLYREPTMAQLFELFRDGELPLQQHTAALDSDIEKNSIGTFWFGRPARLSHHDRNQPIIETMPEYWPEEPSFIQTSSMEYKKGHEPEPANSWEPRWATPDKRKVHTEDEYHVGNNIPIYAINIFVPKKLKDRSRRYVSAAKFLLAGKKVDPADLYGLNDDIHKIMYYTDHSADGYSSGSLVDYPEVLEIPSEVQKKFISPQREKLPPIAIELTEEKKKTIKEFQRFYQWLLDQETLEDHLDVDNLFSGWAY